MLTCAYRTHICTGSDWLDMRCRRQHPDACAGGAQAHPRRAGQPGAGQARAARGVHPQAAAAPLPDQPARRLRATLLLRCDSWPSHARQHRGPKSPAHGCVHESHGCNQWHDSCGMQHPTLCWWAPRQSHVALRPCCSRIALAVLQSGSSLQRHIHTTQAGWWGDKGMRSPRSPDLGSLPVQAPSVWWADGWYPARWTCTSPWSTAPTATCSTSGAQPCWGTSLLHAHSVAGPAS